MSFNRFSHKMDIEHSDTFITEDSIQLYSQKSRKRFIRNSSNSSFKKSQSKEVKEQKKGKEVEQGVTIMPSYIKLNNLLRSPSGKGSLTLNNAHDVKEQKIFEFQTMLQQERIKLKQKEIDHMQDDKKKMKIRIKLLERENFQLLEKNQKQRKQKQQVDLQKNVLKTEFQKLNESNLCKDKLLEELTKITKIKEFQIEKLKVQNEKLKKSRTISVRKIGDSKLQSYKQIALESQVEVLRTQLRRQKGEVERELENTIEQLRDSLRQSKQYISALQIKNNIGQKKNLCIPELKGEVQRLKKEVKNKNMITKGYYEELKELKRQNKKLSFYVRELQDKQLTFSINSERQRQMQQIQE